MVKWVMSRNAWEWIAGIAILAALIGAGVWAALGFPMPSALRCRGKADAEAWACRMEAQYPALDILKVENTVSEFNGKRIFGIVLDIEDGPQEPEPLLSSLQAVLASGAEEWAQPGRELYALLILDEVEGRYVAVAEIDCKVVPRNTFDLEMCDVFGIPGVPADHMVDWPGR